MIKPFINKDESKTYTCETCLDYGGVYDDSTIDPYDGGPVSFVCPDCQGDGAYKEEYDPDLNHYIRVPK